MLNFEHLIEVGKIKRLNRIFGTTGKCVIVPIDDNLISGTFGGLENCDSIADTIISCFPSAILGYKLAIQKTLNSEIPIIYNITASTIHSCHTQKVMISSVEQAISYFVDAIAVHINIGSKYESRMLEMLGTVSERCKYFGIPLFVIIYPRKELLNGGDDNYFDLKSNNREEYTKMIIHCVKIARELGADIIKTHYTGCSDSFKRVVGSAGNIPVLISGGEKVAVKEILSNALGAMKAGAKGVCIGRNVYESDSPVLVINALKNIVFDNYSFSDIIAKYKIYDNE